MELTEEIFQSCNNVIMEETNNVISKEDNNTLQYEQTHNVVLPPEEKKIAVNVSALKKVRVECECAKKTKFSFAELWLGIATLLLGAFFSALISKIPYELNFLSVLFYTICPVCGVGFGVAYLFSRKIYAGYKLRDKGRNLNVGNGNKQFTRIEGRTDENKSWWGRRAYKRHRKNKLADK